MADLPIVGQQKKVLNLADLNGSALVLAGVIRQVQVLRAGIMSQKPEMVAGMAVNKIVATDLFRMLDQFQTVASFSCNLATTAELTTSSQQERLQALAKALAEVAAGSGDDSPAKQIVSKAFQHDDMLKKRLGDDVAAFFTGKPVPQETPADAVAQPTGEAGG